MTTFNWLGGPLDNPLDWGNQPNPNIPVVPGVNDSALINTGGLASGSLTVANITITSAVDFSGTMSSSTGLQVNSGAALTIEASATLVTNNVLQSSGLITQVNGTDTINGTLSL